MEQKVNTANCYSGWINNEMKNKLHTLTLKRNKQQYERILTKHSTWTTVSKAPVCDSEKVLCVLSRTRQIDVKKVNNKNKSKRTHKVCIHGAIEKVMYI